MTFTNWCRQQSWWPVVHPLLEQGVSLIIHVPAGFPTKSELTHRASGAKLIIVPCEQRVPVWHIVFAVNERDMPGVVEQLHQKLHEALLAESMVMPLREMPEA